MMCLNNPRRGDEVDGGKQTAILMMLLKYLKLINLFICEGTKSARGYNRNTHRFFHDTVP